MRRRIPEILTPEEQTRLLGELEPTDCPSRLRNLALIRVMLNAGLRAREVRELKRQNLDLRTGRLKVRGKGGRERVLWLNENDLALVQSWLDYLGTSSNQSSSNLLFTSLDGRRPICGRWLRSMVKRLGEKAGIDRRLHPHLLRHTFATNLLKYTKNLFLVSKALGHANLATTQIYLHLVDGELEAAMKGMNNGNP